MFNESAILVQQPSLASPIDCASLPLPGRRFINKLSKIMIMIMNAPAVPANRLPVVTAPRWWFYDPSFFKSHAQIAVLSPFPNPVRDGAARYLSKKKTAPPQDSLHHSRLLLANRFFGGRLFKLGRTYLGPSQRTHKLRRLAQQVPSRGDDTTRSSPWPKRRLRPAPTWHAHIPLFTLFYSFFFFFFFAVG